MPRNIAVTMRALGLGRSESGRNSPSAMPQTSGIATPVVATATAVRPTRFTNGRSVSMPVSSSSIRMPSCDTPSIMLFCAAPVGMSKCCACGHNRPNTDGPSSTPPMSCPITAGWPIRCAASPMSRPTSSNRPSSPTNDAIELSDGAAGAAIAAVGSSMTEAANNTIPARDKVRCVDSCVQQRPSPDVIIRS